MITVTQLRNIGMVNNNGVIIDFPSLSEKQRILVIKNVLTLLNRNLDTDSNTDIIKANVDDYLSTTNTTGRSILPGFPDFIVRTLISDYGMKLIDYMILQDE